MLLKNENDKKKLAIALKYDKDKGEAPRVVAKGTGKVADNIVEKGSQAGVYKLEDKEVVRELFKLELNEEIPQELYTAVAEILSYVYKLDNEKR